MRVAILLLAFLAQGPKVIVDDGPPTAYLFSAEEKAQLRDLQYQGDQLEIQIQKQMLQIEQEREKQNALVDQMKELAFEVAQRRHIDLGQYELDPITMKFVRKKTK